MKYLILVIALVQFSLASSQVVWYANPDTSSKPNDFFRRFDSGNYPQDFCYQSGDQNGVASSKVSTVNDANYGKIWKINKPKKRKRAEFARTEGDRDYFKPKEGDDVYIGWRWKIDTEDNSGISQEVTVFQWKSEGSHDQNYPLNLEYDGDLTLNAWGPDYNNSTSQASMRTVLWRKPVAQNTWVSIVIRIKVDKGDFGGIFQFWFNGEPQKLSNSQFNKYKVKLSDDKFKAFHRTNDGSGVYPKWGVYNKKSCDYNASAYFDELKIGKKLNDVLISDGVVNSAPSISISSPANNAVYAIGDEIGFSATATDVDGNLDRVNFKLDDKYYSTDKNEPFTSTFTPEAPGTYKVAARAFDADNAATETFVTITVNPDVSLSTDDFTTNSVLNSIKIYPSPATNFLNVVGISSKTQIEVIDIVGKKRLNGFVSENNPKVNVATLSRGIYFLKIIKDGSQKVISFIKK